MHIKALITTSEVGALAQALSADVIIGEDDVVVVDGDVTQSTLEIFAFTWLQGEATWS